MDAPPIQIGYAPNNIDGVDFTEMVYLKLLNRWVIVAGAPVILFYAVVNFRQGNYIQALFFCMMFLDVAVATALVMKLTSFKKIHKIKMVCGTIGFALFAAALINGLLCIDPIRFLPWIFFFPMVVVFFFGHRWGLYWAMIFCLISTAIVYGLRPPVLNEPHQTMLVVNTAAILILILIMTHVSERTRLRVQQDLLTMQDKYKQAELNQRRTNVDLEREIRLRIQSQKALSQSEQRYRALFEESSISLWEEDWSRLKHFLDELPQEAADHLPTYLKDNPKVYDKCVSLIRVTAVNRATLALYGANSTKSLMQNLKGVVLPDSARDHMIDRIISLYQTGRYKAAKTGWTLDGNQRKLLVSSSVPVGCELSWEKIFTSVYEIT